MPKPVFETFDVADLPAIAQLCEGFLRRRDFGESAQRGHASRQWRIVAG